MNQDRWNTITRLILIGLVGFSVYLSSGNTNGQAFFDWNQFSFLIETLNTHEGWIKLAFTYGPFIWVLVRLLTGSHWSLLYDILGLGHSILLWGTVASHSPTPLPWTEQGAIALTAAMGASLFCDLIHLALFSSSAIQF